jgi:hypothetical protein
LIYNKKETAVYVPFKSAPSFKPIEFACKCGICKSIIIDIRLVDMLQKLRNLLDSPIYINSGYRCTRYNSVLIQEGAPAAKLSKHIYGAAADIGVRNKDGLLIDGPQLARIAYMIGFRRIGVSQYWIHVDIEPTKRLALWTYGDKYDLKWLRTHIESQ